LDVQDIISTLKHLNLVRYIKGNHVIAATHKIVEQHLQEMYNKRQQAGPQLDLDVSLLDWNPPVRPVDSHPRGSQKKG